MVAPKLSANMREQVRSGDDLPRQARQIESAAKEAVTRIQDWVNQYLPTTRGGFSPYESLHVIRNSVLPGDSCRVYLVHSELSAITVRLPAPVRDFVVVIKDAGANASVNTITIERPNTTSLIDLNAGPATIMTDNISMWLICDGRDYFSI